MPAGTSKLLCIAEPPLFVSLGTVMVVSRALGLQHVLGTLQLILSTYLSLLGRWDLGSENLGGVLRNTLANKWLTNKAEHRNRMEECNYHGISK